jgi:hypothetical protein
MFLGAFTTEKMSLELRPDFSANPTASARVSEPYLSSERRRRYGTVSFVRS